MILVPTLYLSLIAALVIGNDGKRKNRMESLEL